MGKLKVTVSSHDVLNIKEIIQYVLAEIRSSDFEAVNAVVWASDDGLRQGHVLYEINGSQRRVVPENVYWWASR